jgi:carbon storage regulator
VTIQIEDRKEGTGMLVLSRKAREGVRLLLPDGRVITLRVVQVECGKVRLGIDAPRDVEVMREELLPRQVPPGRGPDGTQGG